MGVLKESCVRCTLYNDYFYTAFPFKRIWRVNAPEPNMLFFFKWQFKVFKRELCAFYTVQKMRAAHLLEALAGLMQRSRSR